MAASRLLIDSDIFVLLAGAALLDRAFALLGFNRSSGLRLPALPHMLARSRKLAQLTDPNTRRLALDACETVPELTGRPDDNVFEQLLAVPDVDEGEAVLYTVIHRIRRWLRRLPKSWRLRKSWVAAPPLYGLLADQPAWLLTSADKRAMLAIGARPELREVRHRVGGRVICLETVLDLLVRHDGVAAIASAFAVFPEQNTFPGRFLLSQRHRPGEVLGVVRLLPPRSETTGRRRLSLSTGSLMGSTSAIEWTESTWNPVTGCTKISPGCKHCYAERMAKRLQAMGQPNYANGFRLTLHHHVVDLPLTWKKPRAIFVNSMSDLFAEAVPVEFIARVFDVMRRAHWHQFQVLTKRSHRLLELDPTLPWLPNIWMGVSVENQDYTFRIDHLRQTHAQTKFLSLEPLLGPIPALGLSGIDWVIVGGESGPGARPMKTAWVTSIRDQCRRANVPFFFKQWGGVHKSRAGRELEGRTWDEMPRCKPTSHIIAPSRSRSIAP